jgi:hypothetical protein
MLLACAGAATAQTVFPPNLEVPPGNLTPASGAPAPLNKMRWRLLYQFDQPVGPKGSPPIEVQMGGLAFASPRLGMGWLTTLVAANALTGRTSLGKGYVVTTRNGGAQWTATEVKGYPRHVHAMDDGTCWMLTSSGIFLSREFGLDWQQRKAPSKRLTRLYFVDENNGYAFGAVKTIWRTTDGARSWKAIPETEKLNFKSPNTWVAAMGFRNKQRGLAVGGSRPERNEPMTYLDALPPWMVPERATRKRELPGSLFVLETADGGNTWTSSIISGFGAVREVRMREETGVAVIQHGESFEWPSEVVRLYPRTNKPAVLFRRKRYTITDAALLENGSYLLAGIEHQGRLREAGIAGKLKIFWSADAEKWVDMRVHYSAQGTQGYLARASDEALFAATDQGQILKLAE